MKMKTRIFFVILFIEDLLNSLKFVSCFVLAMAMVVCDGHKL